MFVPVRWALEDALWLHYKGRDKEAQALLFKIIQKVVKETPDGESR